MISALKSEWADFLSALLDTVIIVRIHNIDGINVYIYSNILIILILNGISIHIMSSGPVMVRFINRYLKNDYDILLILISIIIVTLAMS